MTQVQEYVWTDEKTDGWKDRPGAQKQCTFY